MESHSEGWAEMSGGVARDVFDFDDDTKVVIDSTGQAPIVRVNDPEEGEWAISGFATYEEAHQFVMFGDFDQHDNDWARFHPGGPRLTWSYE